MRKPGEITTDPFRELANTEEQTLRDVGAEFAANQNAHVVALARLTRVNPRLAQQLLATADQIGTASYKSERPMTTSQAIVYGAMLLIDTQDTQRLRDQFSELLTASGIDEVEFFGPNHAEPT